MTGRRLYDALCDEWANQYSWARNSNDVTTMRPTPTAWPFLTGEEKRMFNAVARPLRRTTSPR